MLKSWISSKISQNIMHYCFVDVCYACEYFKDTFVGLIKLSIILRSTVHIDYIQNI